WKPHNRASSTARALAVTWPYALPFSVLRERQRTQCMILTLALRSRARGRPMPNIFSRGRARRRLKARGSLCASWSVAAVVGAAVAVSWNWSASMGLRAETRQPGGRLQAKQRRPLKRGLALNLVLGEYQDCRSLIFPRLPGTPARPSRRVFVFLGLRFSKSAANRPRAGDSLRRVASTRVALFTIVQVHVKVGDRAAHRLKPVARRRKALPLRL